MRDRGGEQKRRNGHDTGEMVTVFGSPPPGKHGGMGCSKFRAPMAADESFNGNGHKTSRQAVSGRSMVAMVMPPRSEAMNGDGVLDRIPTKGPQKNAKPQRVVESLSHRRFITKGHRK